jgi:murein DD-endopeptidase MepM/ murein hydrolase activator NlpD
VQFGRSGRADFPDWSNRETSATLRRLRRAGSLVVAVSLLSLALAGGAAARPDGPLREYIEYQQRLVLSWPADGVLTDGFGPRWGRMHLGLDIGILRSLGVRAAASGFVSAVGWLPGYEGYGQVVIVDVGEGYSVLYAHLSSTAVSVGEWLPAGAVVGAAGCTGSCTGTHLHLELRHRGVPVDPLPFVDTTGYNRHPQGG